MPYSRRFEFEGDDAAYIWYLEDKIFALETYIRSPSRQDACIEAAHAPRSQGSFSSRVNGFEASRAHRSGHIGTFNGREWDDEMQTRSETSANPDDEQHNHNTEEVVSQQTGLKIIEYNPLRQVPKRSQIQENQQAWSSPNENNHCRQSQRDGQRLRVKAEFNSFLEKLPSLKDWISPVDEARRKIILRELVQDYTSAAPTRTTSNDTPKTLADSSAQPVDILPILHQYGQFTARNSSLDRKIAYFRELVFVSSCAVALTICDDKDQVYEVMRAVRGSNAQSKHLGKLVCGAKWANRAISLLSQTEWASRSWSVIFAAERPISFYARFAEFSTETEQLLSNKIKENMVDNSSGYQTTDEAAPLVIPLIVERLFSTSLMVICECLGYNWSDVDSYRSLFNEALDSTSTKRPLESAQLGLSKRLCQGQLDARISDCDDDTPRPRSHCLVVNNDSIPDIQSNVEQNDGIEAPSLSFNTPQGQGSPSLGLRATLVSSVTASSVPNANFSALADPFPTSDFPHEIFNDLAHLREPTQPSFLADPFPASDFPQGVFNDLAHLTEPTQPSFLADPFPASDFPQGVFNDMAHHLTESAQPSFLADPFPASDFPHEVFNALPGLAKSGQSSIIAEPLPAGDFSGNPRGRSTDHALAGELGKCAASSIAPSDSLHGSLDDLLVRPSNRPPNMTSAMLYGDTSEGLADDSSERLRGSSTVACVSNLKEHTQCEVQNVAETGSFPMAGEFSGATQAVC